MKIIGLKDRKNFRINYLQPALNGNLIMMTNPDNPTDPNQKYRLTESGKLLFGKLKK